jgi:hypothetical protein
VSGVAGVAVLVGGGCVAVGAGVLVGGGVAVARFFDGLGVFVATGAGTSVGGCVAVGGGVFVGGTAVGGIAVGVGTSMVSCAAAVSLPTVAVTSYVPASAAGAPNVTSNTPEDVV